MTYTIDRLSPEQMAEVAALQHRKGSEWERGKLSAWWSAVADHEQRTEIAEAQRFQTAGAR